MGFHQTAIEMPHKHFPNVPQYRIMPYQIYTHKDMVLHCANSSEKTGIHQNIIETSKALNTKFEICYNFCPLLYTILDTSTQYSRKMDQNMKSVLKLIKKMECSLQHNFPIVFIHKNKPNESVSNHRYHHMHIYQWNEL